MIESTNVHAVSALTDLLRLIGLGERVRLPRREDWRGPIVKYGRESRGLVAEIVRDGAYLGAAKFGVYEERDRESRVAGSVEDRRRDSKDMSAALVVG